MNLKRTDCEFGKLNAMLRTGSGGNPAAGNTRNSLTKLQKGPASLTEIIYEI